MNEIQRFKKNRMIPKAQDGIKTERRTPGGQVIYDAQEQGEGFFTKLGRWLTTPQNAGTTLGGQTYSVAEPTSKFDVSKWQHSNKIRQRTPEEEARLKDPKIQAYLQRQQKEAEARATATSVDKNAGSTKVGPRKAATDWGKEFTNFMGGLSGEQQEWLRKNGLQDPKMLQEYLNNMKFDVGKFGADGKFGKDSRAAWNKFVASGIMGKNNDQEILKRQLEEQKKTEPVIDAPDPFGYKTTNTYEGDDFASKMKGMGIRSNADLINFMHNSRKAGWKGDAWQTQFRSDVDRALGGDYSDTNIRKVFGTQGKWGRGFLGRGDFGDFQNALQTNAGVWNGMYDRKQEEARMEVGRQQAGARMIKQYMEQNPIQLTAPKKFTINNGMGAKTLGYSGAGSLNTTDNYDWLEVPKQYQLNQDQQLNNQLPNDQYSPSEDQYNLLGNWEKIQATQTGYSL